MKFLVVIIDMCGFQKLNKFSKINKKIIITLLNFYKKINFLGLNNDDLKSKLNKLMNILKSKDIQQMYLSSRYYDYEKMFFENNDDKLSDLFDFNNPIFSNLNDPTKNDAFRY